MGKVKVYISPDAMTAAASVMAMGSDTLPCSREEILNILSGEGVFFGIDVAAVDTLSAAPLGTRVVVANGIPRKPGSDASIRYKIRLSKRAPVETADGKVDFKELDLVKNVRRGQVLAEKIPLSLGEAGKDVKARESPPKKVSDVELPAGKNTTVTPDGMKLVAMIDGHVEIERGKIHVLDTFHHNTAVDMRSGNIHCNGGVEIRGAVKDGFQVTAEKDIHILGQVEGGVVASNQGEIRIDQGVQGHIKGRLSARKNISAKFLENVLVEAGGDVLVRETIVHARIRAQGKIKTLEKPGILLGGEIYSERGIECIDVGNETAAKTVLFLGPWRLQEIENRLVELNEILKDLAAREASGAQDSNLLARRDAANAEKTQLETEQAAIMKRIGGEPPTLRVEGTMHPGVIVRAYPDHEFSPREAKRRFKLTATPKGFKAGAL